MAEANIPNGDELVIIERNALLQLLEATSNALQSTANLEEIAEQGRLDPDEYERLSEQLKDGRIKLIEGIEKLKDGVRQLPGAIITEDLADAQ